MKTRYRNPILTIGLMVLVLATMSQAEVNPTPFVKLFKGDVYINGQPAPTGTIIDAYDPDSVHCGTFTVGSIIDSVGIYGYLRVYGDDTWTPAIDEGAESGDVITFKINGLVAETDVISGSVYWYDKDISEINLSVENVVVDFSIIYP
ncbi:MAG: hypothetical protein U9R56_02605, partial [candidate division Zixibacteria bacterium]|nr:hypothetical protein [candidate division Zixibacteria bacterium]